MRCVPADSEKLLASWSFHFWYFFTPSIQTSRRWTPAGELPLALTSAGEVRLALSLGEQIFAASVADDGGAQLVKPLVARPTARSPPISSLNATSCRESR